MQKFKEAKPLFFEKMNKISSPLAKLTNTKKEKMTAMINIKKERTSLQITETLKGFENCFMKCLSSKNPSTQKKKTNSLKNTNYLNLLKETC